MSHSLDGRKFEVAVADGLAIGEMAAVEVGGWHILIARTASGYFAINNRCSHAASRLESGKLRQNQVICPRHGARFDLASGKCMSAVYASVKTFPLRCANGRLIVTVPPVPPTVLQIPIAW